MSCKQSCCGKNKSEDGHSWILGSSSFRVIGLYDLHVQASNVLNRCIANEVMKTLIAKNSSIMMVVNKQFLSDYLLKYPSNGERHNQASSPL